MTCLPLPFPSDAPSIIPGKSKIWISAPPYSNTPGIAVSVVKLYAATSLRVLVIFERNVDFPTEGNPTSAIRASPDLLTSKPEPPPEPAPAAGSRSWARSRASFLVHHSAVVMSVAGSGGCHPLRRPRWYSMAFVSQEMASPLLERITRGLVLYSRGQRSL